MQNVNSFNGSSLMLVNTPGNDCQFCQKENVKIEKVKTGGGRPKNLILHVSFRINLIKIVVHF